MTRAQTQAEHRSLCCQRRTFSCAILAGIAGLSNHFVFADDASSLDNGAIMDPARYAESTLLAARWLVRQQRSDGFLHYGWNPALHQPLPGDNFLRQAGSAYALASASNYGNEQSFLLSSRRLLAALLEVVKPFRTAKLPSGISYRETTADWVGAHGLLLIAYETLAHQHRAMSDTCDFLADQLLKAYQRDGQLVSVPTSAGETDPGIDYYPGEALFGLALHLSRTRSISVLNKLRRSFAFYQHYWHDHPSESFIPWQSLAWSTIAQLRMPAISNGWREQMVQFVFDMNDWILPLQIRLADQTSVVRVSTNPHTPENKLVGGFRLAGADPDIASACMAEGMSAVAGLAESLPDRRRAVIYRTSLDQARQFLQRLQFASHNTRHFVPDVQNYLHGAVFASPVDGLIRIDFAQHAISAWLDRPS